jgi:hypothetical protein
VKALSATLSLEIEIEEYRVGCFPFWRGGGEKTRTWNAGTSTTAWKEPMMASSSEPATLVTFRGGFVAKWRVVYRILDLEARGLHFEVIEDGRLSVAPRSLLTDDDRAFLHAEGDEARRIVSYVDQIAAEPV